MHVYESVEGTSRVTFQAESMSHDKNLRMWDFLKVLQPLEDKYRRLHTDPLMTRETYVT